MKNMSFKEWLEKVTEQATEEEKELFFMLNNMEEDDIKNFFGRDSKTLLTSTIQVWENRRKGATEDNYKQSIAPKEAEKENEMERIAKYNEKETGTEIEHLVLKKRNETFDVWEHTFNKNKIEIRNLREGIDAIPHLENYSHKEWHWGVLPQPDFDLYILHGSLGKNGGGGRHTYIIPQQNKYGIEGVYYLFEDHYLRRDKKNLLLKLGYMEEKQEELVMQALKQALFTPPTVEEAREDVSTYFTLPLVGDWGEKYGAEYVQIPSYFVKREELKNTNPTFINRMDFMDMVEERWI